MKLEEAVEVLTEERKDHHAFATDIIGRAERLGIEALKRCKVLAENNPLWAAKPLPGETDA